MIRPASWGPLSSLLLYALVVVVLIHIGGGEAAHVEGHDPVVHRCIHHTLGVELDKLPTIRTTHAEDVLMMAAPLTPDSVRTAQSISLLHTTSTRPTKFHIISLLNLSCSTVKQQVPIFTSSDTVACSSEDVVDARKEEAVMNIVHQATDFLSTSLESIPTTMIDVPAAACIGFTNQAVVVEDADFVLFVSAVPGAIPGETIAWGRACAREDGAATGRPVVGHINFIPSFVQMPATKMEVEIARHELSHALGFISLYSSLSSYVDEQGIRHPSGGTAEIYRPSLQKTVRVVQSPRVLQAARTHFGCSTLDGVEIEDMGGPGTAGDHWKKRILYEEALVGVITSAALFYSSLTLAYFEDIGFYKANYALAEDAYRWGHQAGCSFLYDNCRSIASADGDREYCFTQDSTSTERCTYDRLSLGYCDATTFTNPLPVEYRYFANAKEGGAQPTMDYCPAVVSYTNANCVNGFSEAIQNIYGNEYGMNSRCFTSNLVTSALPAGKVGGRCFPTVCTSSGQVLLRIQGQRVACPADGSAGRADTSHLRGVHGFINCPASSEICPFMGASSDGISVPPATSSPATTAHSPIDFNMSASLVASTCAERVVALPSTLFDELYPLCRPLVHQLVEHLGRDCEAQVQQWLLHFVGKNLAKRCHRDRSSIAVECLDGWNGAEALCGMLS